MRKRAPAPRPGSTCCRSRRRSGTRRCARRRATCSCRSDCSTASCRPPTTTSAAPTTRCSIGGDCCYCAASTQIVERLSEEGVPIVGHVGLIPARRTWTGGFKAVGKTLDTAKLVYQQVKALEDAGALRGRDRGRARRGSPRRSPSARRSCCSRWAPAPVVTPSTCSRPTSSATATGGHRATRSSTATSVPSTPACRRERDGAFTRVRRRRDERRAIRSPSTSCRSPTTCTPSSSTTSTPSTDR